jgi:hypothetical protein
MSNQKTDSINEQQIETLRRHRETLIEKIQETRQTLAASEELLKRLDEALAKFDEKI